MLSLRQPSGDTIVEVLLAIGIAAFGIGTTYATAQRGLDQTITAREHNEALNLIQNQVSQLQIRYQTSPSTFEATYGSPTNHFCLDDTNTHLNNGPGNLATTLVAKTAGPYDPLCASTEPGDGVTYYMDITTTQLSGLAGNPSLFQVFVRWEPLGGRQINQASVYFRINPGVASQSSGYTLADSLAKLYAYRGTANVS